ncbi:penicillinase repressor BlaI [Paenibacillus mucilaginosus]|uniref:Penicillinase repressor n=1 Tax=Paenibacillus mucilaginosus (strain KNP414) TaxID=1036673 RepID=F8F5G4_PAEMK|nr:penicillinase repressor BlaI [Paenibacillus mucilaginosus]AEI40975.1 penicillinase repressor [Paenibacillus mucilaginosus KNP414]MCG7211579.1 penicillinase repressor BlaI [Paenibacillus mucilaginosus]WDM30054.1 penicillinase repressor BlaI [Paenibacillus mucilaginosus]
MPGQVPSISEAEWEVMNVLWERAPQTANEVIACLQERTDWKPKTTRTLLDRLVKKEVVGINQNQKVYTFYPLYSQSECQLAEAQSFLKRIYGGTLKSMLVQFIEEQPMSEEEMKELHTILQEKSGNPKR